MIILPAIDIKDGKCVRLFQGDYSTAEVVAKDPVATAQLFEKEGARWLHMVDLDGAKSAKPLNHEVVFEVRKNTKMKIEIGGGIRDMDTVEFYLDSGIDRVILGSAALHNPDFVQRAIEKHGKKIAVGIDALGGKVAADGWLDKSEVNYLELAKTIDKMGASYIIFTDISKDGTLNGPNLAMLDKINNTVKTNIIASGGVSTIMDIVSLHDLGLYGAIVGKSVYSNTLDLHSAVVLAQRISHKTPKNRTEIEDHLDRYFAKSDLIPAIVQDFETDEVLMMAYMNRESFEKTLNTGETWFYSRSRNELWHKGETSGHTQKIITINADCDDDTLLIKVKPNGPACHTGKNSCFYKEIARFKD